MVPYFNLKAHSRRNKKNEIFAWNYIATVAVSLHTGSAMKNHLNSKTFYLFCLVFVIVASACTPYVKNMSCKISIIKGVNKSF